MKLKLNFLLAIFAFLLFVDLPASASYTTEYMNVGDTKTLYLGYVSNLKGTQWTISDQNAVQFVYSPTNYSTSVTIKAVAYTGLTCVVQCTYYYYLNNGRFTYLAEGYKAWKIVVEKQDPTGISVSPSSKTITNGSLSAFRVDATISPSSATTDYSWRSTNTEIATVVDNGSYAKVILQGESGEADIIVTTSNNLSASCHLTVVPPTPTVPVTGVSVTPAEYSIDVGDTYPLSASVSPSDASNKSLTWKSTNPDKVKVSKNGVITGLAKGSSEITATSNNGKVGKCQVTCYEKLPDIEIKDTEDLSDLPLQANVTYTRHFYKGLNSICVPFAVSKELISELLPNATMSSCKYYEYQGDNRVLILEDLESASPGTPFIINCPEEKTVTFSVKRAELIKSPVQSGLLIGSFKKSTIGQGYYKLTESGIAITDKDDATVSPFRGYISATKIPESEIPCLVFGGASNITSSSASVSATIVNIGADKTISRYGHLYSSDGIPDVNNASCIEYSECGHTTSFETILNDLSPNTRYICRAFAENSFGIGYSDTLSFFTEYGNVDVYTEECSSITTNSIQIGGGLNDDGGYDFKEVGVCYCTEKNPTIENSTVKGTLNESHAFHIIVNNLQPKTQYYFKSYFIANESIVFYGEEKTCRTEPIRTAPVVNATVIDEITSSSCRVSSSITSDGDSDITNQGFCIAETENPTLQNGKVFNCNTSNYSFSTTISSLSYLKKYYVRAYATNDMGTSYGEQTSFNTPASVPTVFTGEIVDITSTSAVVSAQVTDNGGSDIIERGIVWSDSQNPAVDLGTKIIDNTPLESITFDTRINDLQPGAIYYIRAYAINASGVGYGEIKSIRTEALLPTIFTVKIDENYSSCTGNVISDGGSTITARGIVWSTSHNPEINLTTKTENGSGVGLFTGTMTDLLRNTTYYVRAYATNSKGTSYGEEFSLTCGVVDLGLSVCWSTSNLGAGACYEYGNYYAWGERKTKTKYEISTYKYYTKPYITKYCTSSNYGNVDNKITLEESDDVARYRWESPWRIPTRSEWVELYSNCTWAEETINGIYGLKFTSKVNGYTDKWIFLPATGYYNENENTGKGYSGEYWSSSLATNCLTAYSFNFNLYFVYSQETRIRAWGLTIRPVCDRK